LVLLFSLLFLGIYCAVIPARPLLPEAFQTTAQLLIKLQSGPYVSGKGIFALNQPKGWGLANFQIPQLPYLNSLFVQRYDLNTSYELDGSSPNICTSSPTEATMHPVWEWVREATYKGQERSFGLVADVWELDKGFANIAVAVEVNNSKVPLWTREITSVREINIIFAQFDSSAPGESVFAIPSSCQSQKTIAFPTFTPPLRCLARSTVLAKAQVWVNNKVPYNQQGYYDGYREDCSGYVSMSWGLNKPGLTTFTLGTVSHPITKDDLQPGDILLDRSEHVVLFGGWTDSAKTHYVAYEETRPGEGTVKRTTPYPYWYNTNLFLPYRYNAIC